MWRACNITLINSLARLLQSIWQIGQYYIKIAMKLITQFLAMLQSTLGITQSVARAWLTHIELSACFHLANTDIHQDLHNHCEPTHCLVMPLTNPSIQDMSIIAIALLTLWLAVMDWHVPRETKLQPLTCCILTAMCMHALRMNGACTAMALILPTFETYYNNKEARPESGPEQRVMLQSRPRSMH